MVTASARSIGVPKRMDVERSSVGHPRCVEIVVAVIAFFVSACSAGAGPTPVVRALASIYNPSPSSHVLCDDALLTGTLAADPSDPWGAWVVRGQRVNVRWPPGFRISFDNPTARLLTADGTFVASVGEGLALGGGVGPDGVFAACNVRSDNDHSPASST
jgi:hypothetical protein